MTDDYWYAWMIDKEDICWGIGSFERSEAIARLIKYHNDYPNSYIAVINNSVNPVCVDKIEFDDINEQK